MRSLAHESGDILQVLVVLGFRAIDIGDQTLCNMGHRS